MSAATSRYVTASSSPDSADMSHNRPGVHRENTSSILDYYTSADASTGYSAADLAHSRAAQQHKRRPSTAPSPSSEIGPEVPSKDKDYHPTQSPVGSIRLVTSNRNPDSTAIDLLTKRRPSLHHADSVNVVMNNRRMAIIERDASPPQGVPNVASPASSGSANGHEGSPTLLTNKRGTDRSRLALVSPPDAAPSSYTAPSSPPSAAAFALSKSSKQKHSEAHRTADTGESSVGSSYTTTSHRVHKRSSSENAPIPFHHNSNTPQKLSGSNSGEGTHSTRDMGMPRNTSRLSGEHKLTDHGRQRSASSGSDYGDDPSTKPTPIPPRPNHSTKPRASISPSQLRPSVTDHNHSGLHIPLPAGPRYFGSSAGTPMLTPAIGDTKPIDLKVAAPVVVDIRSDLADLWLAATPDTGDQRETGSGLGSPMTATTTTSKTDSSSMPTSATFSTSGSSRQSSLTSPLQRHAHSSSRESTMEHRPQFPPKRVDVNVLPSTSDTLPIVPPRPQRQPSPVKITREPRPSLDGHGHDRTSASTIKAEDTGSTRSKSSKHSRSSSRAKVANEIDSKYSLANVSDDSHSEYSVDERSSRHGRSRSVSKSGSLSRKSGTIHLREGAFPPHSVFLDRVRTEGEISPPHDDMKTPTAKHNLETLFQHAIPIPVQVTSPTDGEKTAVRSSFDVQESGSQPSSSLTSNSKMSHGRSSSELPPRRPGPSTSEAADEEEPLNLTHSSSMRSNNRPKEPEEVNQRYARSGKRLGGIEPSSPQHDSATESSMSHHQYAHTHLGHGPPPTARNLTSAPSAFKAKGPLNTSGSLRSARSKKASTKPRSMWPSAMSFADVISEQTPLARARGYAAKINELSTEDCGLGDWITTIMNRNRPTVDTPDGPIPVGPSHLRFVSGSSAVTEATFPMRPDAYKAIDITPGGADMESSEVPSTLPYPTLALRQQMTGSRTNIAPITPTKTGISAVVSSPGTFLATLGRKASMRSRGNGSATESEKREKEPRAPRKLVSRRERPRENGTPPMPSTPLLTAPSLPSSSAPTIPGGPRAPRPKRASTVMVSGSRPIISAPIPIIIPHSQSDPIPTEATKDIEPSDSPTSPIAHPPLTMSRDVVPRNPHGPRPPSKLVRTPSFPGPGSTRLTVGGNIRSTMSFRPVASRIDMAPTGATNMTRSDVGIGLRRHDQPMDSREFERQLNKLCDVLPHAPRDTLAIYLTRADGQNMIAIGRYLEDERQGTVLKSS